MARRKHIPVVVRLKELQPGDLKGLYVILTQCLAAQLDQVFASLDEQGRSDSLLLLAQEIASRYKDLTADESLEPCGAEEVISTLNDTRVLHATPVSRNHGIGE